MGEPNGEVLISQDPSAVIVTVVGDIDLANAVHIQAAVNEAVDTAMAQSVVLQLRGVTFLGSPGLTLLHHHTRTRAIHAGLRLCVVTGDNRAVTRPLQHVLAAVGA